MENTSTLKEISSKISYSSEKRKTKANIVYVKERQSLSKYLEAVKGLEKRKKNQVRELENKSNQK